MSHAIDAFDYALKAKYPHQIKLRAIVPAEEDLGTVMQKRQRVADDAWDRAMIEQMEIYNSFPIYWGKQGSNEVHELKPDPIPFPPQLIKRYKKTLLELRQIRFDRCIDRLRRVGLMHLANRVIIRDLVKGWPKRDGRW